MADWTAPFHMPKFNNAEYLEAKAKHVAKYGYTITVPALSDIFHFGQPKPMSPLEVYEWERGNMEYFDINRREEIRMEKEHKKDRMLAMLKSPTPEMFAKLGAILTAVDDAQDAISTLGAVARIGRKIAPKALGRIISGPLGMLLTANDILNFITTVGTPLTFAGFGKRTKDLMTGSNPFTKKARLKRLIKMGKWVPTFGDVVQAAQTTDQIFGIGVSLGPIVGFAQDIFHGAIKSSVGMKVSMKFSPHSVPDYVKTAYSLIKSVPAHLALAWNSPDEDILLLMQAQAMAQETILPWQRTWNPFDLVNNIEGSLIHCPVPTHPTTLWAMHDLDINIEDVMGWPLVNKVWASPVELAEAYEPGVTKMVFDFVTRHNHDSMGVLMCSLVADSAMYQMANIVGEESVEVDYTVPSKLATSLLLTNIIPRLQSEQEPSALARVISFIDKREEEDNPITAKDFKKFADSVGYKFNLL